MRSRLSWFGAVVVAVAVVGGASLPARAASGACAVDDDCAAVVGGPPTCRLVEHLCVWVATEDPQTLIDAVTAANLDAAPDVIFVGDPNRDATQPGTQLVVSLSDATVTDTAFGPLLFPVVKTPITVEGESADLVVLDTNTNARDFLVQVDAVLDVRPSLTLKNLTFLDARPGANDAGNVVGGGAVELTADATTTGLLATLTASDVVFTSSGDDDAVGDAVLNLAGGDVTLTRCTFDHDIGNVAGAVEASSGTLHIVDSVFDHDQSDAGAGAITTATDTFVAGASSFTNNGGTVGAVDATLAQHDDGTGTNTLVDVTLEIDGAVFTGNGGVQCGGVRSVAKTILVSDTFTQNHADDSAALGGAVLARSLTLNNGLYKQNSAPAGGGALAILDVPPSGPVLVSGARFALNTAGGTGGAIFATGATISIDSNFFDGNESDSGAAIYVKDLVDRNGAAPDAIISLNEIDENTARPVVSIRTGDTTLDELGDDTGEIDFDVVGLGSALVVDGTGVVSAHDNCIIGNAAPAILTTNSGAVALANNWYGASSGPGPVGQGDLLAPGVIEASFATSVASPCTSTPTSGFLPIFIQAEVTTDSATPVVDYHVLDESGRSVFNGRTGEVVPDLRSGTLTLTVAGVNDADVEGNETFTFTIDPCGAGACDYTLAGQSTIGMTITDNGNGAGEGEGEGEGAACAEKLRVTPTALGLPDTGKPSSASIKVVNESPCTVQLFAPFMQKGASQGFAVKPILQKDLTLDTGGSVVVLVTYTPPPPDSEGDASSAPPAGLLVLETAGGTLVDVDLTLASGCSCASTHDGVPATALALLATGALFVVTRKRRSS